MRCYKINPDKLKDYGFKYNVYRIVGYQYKQKPIIFIDFIVTDSTLRYNVVKQNGDTYFPYYNSYLSYNKNIIVKKIENAINLEISEMKKKGLIIWVKKY